jgi:hypothetical protein
MRQPVESFVAESEGTPTAAGAQSPPALKDHARPYSAPVKGSTLKFVAPPLSLSHSTNTVSGQTLQEIELAAQQTCNVVIDTADVHQRNAEFLKGGEGGSYSLHSRQERIAPFTNNYGAFRSFPRFWEAYGKMNSRCDGRFPG